MSRLGTVFDALGLREPCSQADVLRVWRGLARDQPYLSRLDSLRERFRVHAMEAMRWVLMCAMEGAPFNQEMDTEIPMLCTFYNDYIGEDSWSEQDHTMMAVLNRYRHIKAAVPRQFCVSVQR